MVIEQVSQRVDPEVHSQRMRDPQGPGPPVFPYLAETWVVAAMGTCTCMGLLYANLFMGKLELEFLRTQDKIHVHVPRVWWRYIDDIFTIWDHGEPSL